MKDLLLTDFFAVKTIHSTEVQNSEQLKVSPVKSKTSQTYLNLGQRDFFHSCPKCQMTFNPAESSDVALHKKYHNFYTKGITLPGNSLKYSLIHTIQEYSFVKCHLNDSNVRKENLEIIHYINIELGCSFLQIERTKADYYNAIILINASNIVVGYLQSRKIDHAYRYSCNELGGEFVKLDQRIEAKLGISIIWISPGLRRKGFAKLLLDTAMNNQEIPIAMHEIAFSQPTQAGKSLFSKFLGSNNPLLIYLEE